MKDGRDRIFNEWLAGHQGILFKVVHAYAFEHADRQDLFQEIALHVWRSVDAFRGERVEWLYRQIAQLKNVDRSVALLILDGFSYEEIAGIVGITESNVGVKIYDDDPRTSWDVAHPIVGAAVFLLWACFLYLSRRAQALRERRFGGSLRDQVARHLAQLDYHATRAVRPANVLRDNLAPFVAGIAMMLAGWRINNEPFRTQWPWIVGGILFMGIITVGAVWLQRRRVKRELLPRKRRLEALLKELDAP